MSKNKKPYIKLKAAWQKHFEGLRFDPKLAINKNKYHTVYNQRLREFLIDCQKKDFLPSKDYLTNYCEKLQSEVRQVLSLNGAKEDRLDAKLVDLSLANMEFSNAIFTHDDNGVEYNCRRYVLWGLVPIKGLTEGEREWILGCFSNDGKLQEDFLTVTLIDVRFSTPINEEKKDKINSYGKRIARDSMSKYLALKGYDTGFNYTLMQKIKDKWLDSGI